MPTGWRPDDVETKIKRDKIIDVYNQQKYKIEYKNIHIFYALFILYSLILHCGFY